MAHAIYDQKSGSFEIFADIDDGGVERCIYTAVGYAGRGRQKNSPACECQKARGPLPKGFYRVGLPVDHPRLGPMAFRLHPYRTNRMCGRSGFWVHGDSAQNPGQASHGCIILDRAARSAIVEYDVRSIEVLNRPAQPGT